MSDYVDFPAFLINTPCVVLGTNLPQGIYDKDGNCVIKVPYDLHITRPDELKQTTKK